MHLVQIVRAAKQLYPDKPIILSRWHTSLLPDQTLACRPQQLRGFQRIEVEGRGRFSLIAMSRRSRPKRAHFWATTSALPAGG